jgi:hypothetical protein
VVTGKALEIGVKAEQVRRPGKDDPCFLLEFPRQRLLYRLAPLHPAAREMPTRLIAVAHQENPVAGVEHDTLRSHRQPPSDAPVALERLGEDSFRNHICSSA